MSVGVLLLHLLCGIQIEDRGQDFVGVVRVRGRGRGNVLLLQFLCVWREGGK